MNRSFRTLLSVGCVGGAVSLSGTAFAQAWSHSSIKSYSAEIAPGSLVNAGFTVSGESSAGAGAQAGGVRAIQQNTFWAKLKSQTKTIASLRSFANAQAGWGTSQVTNTSLSATLFGQTVPIAGGTCAGTTTCSSSKSGQKSGGITDEHTLWMVGIEGLSLQITGQLRGTAGYGFSARATSAPRGGFAETSTSASNGAFASVELVTKGKVIVGPFDASVRFIAGTKVDVVRANFTPTVTNRMTVNSRTDLDLAWSNRAPLTLSSAGGSIIVQACAPVVGCTKEATPFKWKGFSTTQVGYSDIGGLNDQRF